MESPQVGETNRIHLNFLDGMRGLAALYVMLYHCYQFYHEIAIHYRPNALQKGLSYLLFLCPFGYFAVTVFLVLSGYSLMIPVARNPKGEMAVGSYFWRRAWRILPPYYGALALWTLFLAPLFHPGIALPAASFWARLRPTVNGSTLFSHLLLIHNFSPHWSHQIDAPMWSIATEWQIYFFLPFFILPLWHRYGIPKMVFAAMVLGFLPCLWFHRDIPEGFWMLGIFALGVAGAIVNWSPTDRWAARCRTWRWPAVVGALGIAMVVLFALWPPTQAGIQVFHAPLRLPDVLVALFATSFIVSCVQNPRAMRWPLRCLQSPPVRLLGDFSYSLYLIHYPVLNELAHALRVHRVGPAVSCLVLFGIGAPIAVLAAYLFYLAVERPTLRYRRRLGTKQSTPSSITT
ncbi:predicted acyltransferase [Chthonomonas calidirosea]|uniref:Predicted acyltransferases n=1 Tax=Chthonomonas calidirosea (strain DSM 23976 / ICMP 18418 / T49) TaxID=1303518 RepID=S0EX63_CHTCT|nr:acyltransferase [Chthonomonas calidirosea]CCW36321.1 Predicted acyltransferases [Chthonomonas calidirosea T49]CEK17678.1 predicted acyltransferase [Chthonomonas calidirosea]